MSVSDTHAAPRRFRFADLELRTSPEVLTRSGRPLALQPQPARALSLLVRRAGEVVTREELRLLLWGRDRHLDVEQGINFTIRRIRSVLDDDPASPRFIETVPRVGYRFVAPVEEQSEAVAPATLAAPRRRPGVATSATAILGLLAAVLIAWRFAGPTSARDAKLAVLPFTSASVDTVEPTLPAELTEELTTSLAADLAPQLGIIAWRSASTAGGDERVEHAGARLGADYLLRGNVARVDGRLRITVRLWRVSDGVHLWGRAFQPTVGELPAWYGEVAAQVAAALGIESRESPPAEARGTIPSAAYEAYLQGRYLIGRREAPAIEKGLSLLADAVAGAPGLAAASVAVADGRLKLFSLRPAGEAGTSDLALAEAAARRALELDPSLEEAHAVLAEILFFYRLDWAGARLELERALELSPRSVRALHTYGLYLSSLGRHDEAIAFVRRAVDLDPATIYVSSDLAQVYFWARRYDGAIVRARANLELDPGDQASRACLIEALLAKGDRSGALREANRLLERLHLAPAATLDEATRVSLDYLLALERRGRSLDLQMAGLYLSLGDEERALDRLETACRERRQWTVPFLAVDPRFDPLRERPRYRALGDCLAPIGAPS